MCGVVQLLLTPIKPKFTVKFNPSIFISPPPLVPTFPELFISYLKFKNRKQKRARHRHNKESNRSMSQNTIEEDEKREVVVIDDDDDDNLYSSENKETTVMMIDDANDQDRAPLHQSTIDNRKSSIRARPAPYSLAQLNQERVNRIRASPPSHGRSATVSTRPLLPRNTSPNRTMNSSSDGDSRRSKLLSAIEKRTQSTVPSSDSDRTLDQLGNMNENNNNNNNTLDNDETVDSTTNGCSTEASSSPSLSLTGAGDFLKESATRRKLAAQQATTLANRGTSDISLQLRERQDKMKRKVQSGGGGGGGSTGVGRSGIGGSGVSKVMTMDDLRQMREMDRRRAIEGGPSTSSASSSDRSIVHTIGNTLYDADRIGREALQLTNVFRAKHNLPPLTWSQPIAEIGKGHSRDMGDGRAPFNHDGFDERVARYPVPSMGAAENLAWCSESVDAARIAVDGWIKSPGHRANLLARHSHCGIGVYRSPSAKIYLTQLFALY